MQANTAVRNLIAVLEGSNAETNTFNSVIEDIDAAIENIDDITDVPADKPFAAFSTDASTAASNMANTIAGKARNVDEYPEIASVLGEGYGRLLRAARGAAFSAGQPVGRSATVAGGTAPEATCGGRTHPVALAPKK